MHPKILARDNTCSGGECPAVYEAPGMPDDLLVQGKKVSPGLLATLTGVAPDETALTIGRKVVTEALRPAPEPLTRAEFAALFDTFAYSAWRLETLQVYAGTARDDGWIAKVKANTRWGKTHARVHVVTEPLSPAMTEELTAGYEGNVAAGEDIRIIPAAPGEWPPDVLQLDFWLFDSSVLAAMDYDEDGNFLGAVRIRDPQQIVEACRVRDAAWHRAVPWHDYITSRPDLQQRIAQ